MSDNAGHPFNGEIGTGAVADGFNPAQVFQCVEDGFDQSLPLPAQEGVFELGTKIA